MLYLSTQTLSGLTTLYIRDAADAEDAKISEAVPLGTSLTPQQHWDAFNRWVMLLAHAEGGMNLDGGPADPGGPGRP